MNTLFMHLAISLLVLLFCGGVVAFVFVMVVVDMAGKFDYLQQHFPRLLKWSEKRELHGFLLLICVGLLAGNGYELMTRELPDVQLPPIVFKPSEVPKTVTTYSKQKESPNSLRRRTLGLVNDLIVFWNERPAPQMQPVQNPSTDEERQRNAKSEQYWRDVNTDYLNANYRERILRIVREYKNKGIPTGYLEPSVEQYNRLVGSTPFGGTGLEDCFRFMSDLCVLRELAYHIDENDQPVFLASKPPKQ